MSEQVTPQDLTCALEDSISQGPPGLSAVLATRDGIVWSGTAGHADLQNQVAVNESHLFGIGSITKTFVAVVTIQLIEEGKLKATDTAADILGTLVAGIPNGNKAQVSHLLNHTSGIPSWEDDPKWIRQGRGEDLNVDHIWGKDESLTYITGEEHKPLFAPGERYNYSNSNHTLLGLMIEKITGNDVVTEIENRIRAPLGLSSIYLEGFEPTPKHRLARRYHYNTGTFKQNAGMNTAFDQVSDKLIDVSATNLSVEWTAGGMVVTARNLATYALALRGGKLLKPESQKYLFDWRPTNHKDDPGWIGHGLFRTPTAEGIMINHGGSVLGYTGYMGWHEEDDLIIIILANAGTMHTGGGMISAGRIAHESKFARLAHNFAKHVEHDQQHDAHKGQ